MDEKLLSIGCPLKNLAIRGGEFTKNQYRGGDCLKRGFGQFANLRGGLCKKEGGGGVFEGG